MLENTVFKQSRVASFRFKLRGLVFFSFSAEALIAGFYIAVTRSITPILLIASGYRLEDILLVNGFAGLFSLIIGLLLYKYGSRRISKLKLLMVHVLERAMWFAIPFMVGDRFLLTLVYGLAVASTLPTSIYMQTAILSSFSGVEYRRVVSVRSGLAAFSSILGHVFVVLTLATLTGQGKYLGLYETAFGIGVLSSVIIALTPKNAFKNSVTMVRNGGFEAEAKATNTYILLVAILSSYMLLNMAWTPRIMYDLKAPDYIAASIGFAQTAAAIGSSFFWANRSSRTYRYALIMLTSMPLLVYITLEPRFHIALALMYGFSIVGVNLYAARMYSGLVGEIGVFRAGLLLASTGSFALTLASIIGYTVSAASSMVFLASAILGIAGLTIALTGFPEFAIIPKNYVQLYSKIMYQTSISSYNLAAYAISESAKTSLRIIGLSITLILLFIIYRTLYYITIITGG